MPSHDAATMGNQLLEMLPRREVDRILAAGDSVELLFSETLVEPGERIRHVYFPTTGFISTITPMRDHGNLEVGLIGREGMFGATLLLGVNTSPLHALVQGGGQSLRLGVPAFRRVLKQSPALERKLGNYLYVVMRQLAQAAACNRFHLVEERLARWLLMTRDRAHEDTFHITHEFLAGMLGVRRVGITKAASTLQGRALIHYHRGDITILDLAGLKAIACECYATDKATYAEIMA